MREISAASTPLRGISPCVAGECWLSEGVAVILLAALAVGALASHYGSARWR